MIILHYAIAEETKQKYMDMPSGKTEKSLSFRKMAQKFR